MYQGCLGARGSVSNAGLAWANQTQLLNPRNLFLLLQLFIRKSDFVMAMATQDQVTKPWPPPRLTQLAAAPGAPTWQHRSADPGHQLAMIIPPIIALSTRQCPGPRSLEISAAWRPGRPGPCRTGSCCTPDRPTRSDVNPSEHSPPSMTPLTGSRNGGRPRWRASRPGHGRQGLHCVS